MASSVSGLLQVNKYSCWFQMENSGGLARRTTVVSFIHMENYYRWKTIGIGNVSG